MRRTRVVAAAAVLAVPALAFGAQSSASASPLLGGLVSQLFTNNLLPGLTNATNLGAAPTSTPMSLVVGLSRPDPAGESQYLAAEEDPQSPQYHQFLTPSAFAAKFGVPAATRSAVVSWLTSSGLHVDSVSAAGDNYAVSGTASQVSSTFKTSIRRFTTAGKNFLANTSYPAVPSGLPVNTIVGLNTLQGFSTPAKATTAQDTCLASTCLGVTTPKDLWSVYDQPAAYQGQGQQLAVFGEGQTADVISDLRQFETANGLPQIAVTVKHPAGDTDFSDDTGREEWNIDTQASSGMAPQADGMTLYFGSTLSDADVLKMFQQWTDDASGPMQANASFGECETNPTNPVTGGPLSTLPLPIMEGLGNNLQPQAEGVLKQAAMEGKTLFSSTGDTGSSCPVIAAPVIGAGNGLLNQVVPLTNYPASSQFATAVGGTVLYTDGAGNRSQEYAWTFTGGGSSLLIGLPDYQQGVSDNNIPCLQPTPGAVCRAVPDVAAQSGDVLTNGYQIYSAGAATEGGGTSLSSPLWMGMWTRVQGAKGGAGNGFANYPLYAVGKNATTEARDYTDITLGSNGLYTAGPGWDYTTGWGAPKVAGLICDIAGKC
ncbi:MAG TPA: S53 family peptidase [Frankiaceae bacterium]|jgi:subtilase family serine protease|nr:S53 family peptidase [Frankiaceae bacterium]